MKFVDVFCGAGGFTEGLKQAGWQHVVGIEWDKYAAATYEANHRGVIVKDARLVDMDDLAPFIPAGGVDVLVGSPPCTSFSTAGKRSPGDERDGLYKEVVRLAALLNPRMVIMENVMGMLSKKESASGKAFVDLIVDELAAIGYRADYRVLTATQFGVPQRRRRVIFVACRNDSPDRPRFPPPMGAVPHPLFSQTSSQLSCLREVLEPHAAVPARFFLPDAKVNYFESRGRYARWLDVELPCPTLRASYFRSRGEHGLIRLDDGRVRMLTPTEAARVQGFPAHYVWPGSLSQVYKQIGNAVAPPMAKAIATALA